MGEKITMAKIQIPPKVGRIQKIMGVPCYIVGGAVIDTLRNIQTLDYDIEVFGLSYEQIQTKLENAGYKCKLTGKAFGVLQVVKDGVDFDISVPRVENRLGVGHRDFKVCFVSDMTPKEAALRRGLTIEALMAAIPSGEILDPNNGLNDLKGSILRMNNAKTFGEDPLRVLRIAQNLSRGRGNIVDYLTIARCRAMTPEHLSKERIWGEWQKILIGEKPSLALEFLDKIGWIKKYWPELDALHGVYQRPDYHAEGDVWIHTLMVLDQGAKYKHEVSDDFHEQLCFMIGLMLHDIGKVTTTDKDGSAIGHERAGVKPAKAFMKRMTDQDFPLVWEAIECHLRPFQLEKEGKKSAYKRLHNRIRLDFVGWFSYCDHKGRITTGSDERGENALAKCLHYFKEFGKEPIPPHIMGRDLIELGMTPGKHFKDVLDRAYNNQIEDGLSKVELLSLIPKWMELA